MRPASPTFARLYQRLAARVPDLRRRLIGALDPDIGIPRRRRRRRLGHRRHGGDIAAAETPDEVLALRPRRRNVLELPAEQAAVKSDGSLWVGLAGIDPAGDAGDVSISLGHCCSFR